MPIYEYECQECGRVFEKIQRFSDDPLTEYECVSCGRTTPVKKLVSAAAFHLKGGGWYVTDFRDGGKKGGNGQKDSEPGAAGKSEPGDGKPAPKSETKSESGSKGESGSASKSESKSASKSESKPTTKSAGGAT